MRAIFKQGAKKAVNQTAKKSAARSGTPIMRTTGLLNSPAVMSVPVQRFVPAGVVSSGYYGNRVQSFVTEVPWVGILSPAVKKRLSCNLWGGKFKNFDLTPLERQGGRYNAQGITWNFCESLADEAVSFALD